MTAQNRDLVVFSCRDYALYRGAAALAAQAGRAQSAGRVIRAADDYRVALSLLPTKQQERFLREIFREAALDG